MLCGVGARCQFAQKRRILEKQLMGRSKQDLRSLRQAAMRGDLSAAKALLRLYHFNELAAEIKRGFPFSPRVKKMVLALTAGTGEGDEPAYWERRNERGEIQNLLLNDPPGTRARRAVFEEPLNDE